MGLLFCAFAGFSFGRSIHSGYRGQHLGSLGVCDDRRPISRRRKHSTGRIHECLPIPGGFMNAWVGWRGNYGSVALLSLIAWIGLFTLLPETKRQRVPVSIRKI